MKYALLFRENEENVLVSAEDIQNGKYSRCDEFVDPEYEFKVQYVKGARNNGGPYFRMYYSYEEYKCMCPDRKTRYEILFSGRVPFVEYLPDFSNLFILLVSSFLTFKIP